MAKAASLPQTHTLTHTPFLCLTLLPLPQVRETRLLLEQLSSAKATSLVEAQEAQQAAQEALQFTNSKFAGAQASGVEGRGGGWPPFGAAVL